MKRLNIPFEHITTRRSSRRVVSLTILFVFALMISGLLHRFWITRDTTSAYAPEGTETHIRVVKTSRTTKILHEKLGNTPILTSANVTVDDVLRLSRREFTVHLSGGSIVGVSIDNQLSERRHRLLNDTGTSTFTDGVKTLITTVNTEPNLSRARFSLTLLNPLTQAEILTKNENEPVHINKHRITIKTNEKIPPAIPVVTPGNPTDILGFASLNQALSFPISHPITSQNLFLFVGQDTKGLSYTLSLASTDVSLETLASFGKDAVNRRSLSTTALTLEDGTRVQELRANPIKLTTEITEDAGNGYIRVANEAGDVLRLVKTPERITISNRDISTNLSEISLSTSCIKHPQIFLSPALFTDRSQTNTVLSNFRVIVGKKHKLAFCW